MGLSQPHREPVSSQDQVVAVPPAFGQPVAVGCSQTSGSIISPRMGQPLPHGRGARDPQEGSGASAQDPTLRCHSIPAARLGWSVATATGEGPRSPVPVPCALLDLGQWQPGCCPRWHPRATLPCCSRLPRSASG